MVSFNHFISWHRGGRKLSKKLGGKGIQPRIAVINNLSEFRWLSESEFSMKDTGHQKVIRDMMNNVAAVQRKREGLIVSAIWRLAPPAIVGPRGPFELSPMYCWPSALIWPWGVIIASSWVFRSCYGHQGIIRNTVWRCDGNGNEENDEPHWRPVNLPWLRTTRTSPPNLYHP